MRGSGLLLGQVQVKKRTRGGHPGGSLGSPQGSLGGPWGSLGVPGGAWGVPGEVYVVAWVGTENC